MTRELPKPLYVLLGARAGGFLRPSYFYFIGERKMELKGPLSFSQQVKLLQEHGMCISDPKDAERKLSKINYYRFTGYALSLRGDREGNRYVSGTDFDMVYRLYLFDEELRNALKLPLERVEIFARTQISYWFSIAKNKKSPHMAHYKEENFYNKEHYRQVMDSISREEQHRNGELFVQHHKEKYEDKMPLWVIVELLSFSNLSKLYNSMWISEKESIAISMGNIHEDTLKNHLRCLSELRNRCAHGARLYGKDIRYSPPAQLTSQFLIKNRDICNTTLFAYIIVLIRRQPSIECKRETVEMLIDIFKRYEEIILKSEIGLPERYEYILNREIK